MPDPAVVRLAREYRNAIASGEAAQVADLTRRWLAIEKRLDAEINALAIKIAEMRAAGEVVTAKKLYELDQYRVLLARARSEITTYTRYAEGVIAGRQLDLAALGAESAREAIEAVMLTGGELPTAFALLNSDQVLSFSGLASDGSPLSVLLRQVYGDASVGLTNKLVISVGLGINPQVIAREIAKGMSLGYSRVLRIARTESIRAFREASRAQYAESGLVTGYKRLAARNPRTCAACLIRDGAFYDLDAPLDEHVNGRCTLVPVVRGFAPPQWQSGRSWMLSLTANEQREILGPLYDGWRDGQFDLDDVVATRRNATWGDSIQVKSLRELIG